MTLLFQAPLHLSLGLIVLPYMTLQGGDNEILVIFINVKHRENQNTSKTWKIQEIILVRVLFLLNKSTCTICYFDAFFYGLLGGAPGLT